MYEKYEIIDALAESFIFWAIESEATEQNENVPYADLLDLCECVSDYDREQLTAKAERLLDDIRDTLQTRETALCMAISTAIDREDSSLEDWAYYTVASAIGHGICWTDSHDPWWPDSYGSVGLDIGHYEAHLYHSDIFNQ